MKRTRISLIALITLIVTLAAFAQPQPRPRGAAGPGPGPGGPEAMHGPGGPGGPGRGILPPQALAEFLGLSDAQKEQAKAHRTTLEEAIKPLREQARANQEAIRAAVEAGNATAAGEKLIANDKIREQIQAEHEKFETAFTAILNAEQKAKFEVFQEIQELRRPRPRP